MALLCTTTGIAAEQKPCDLRGLRKQLKALDRLENAGKTAELPPLVSAVELACAACAEEIGKEDHAACQDRLGAARRIIVLTAELERSRDDVRSLAAELATATGTILDLETKLAAEQAARQRRDEVVLRLVQAWVRGPGELRSAPRGLSGSLRSTLEQTLLDASADGRAATARYEAGIAPLAATAAELRGSAAQLRKIGDAVQPLHVEPEMKRLLPRFEDAARACDGQAERLTTEARTILVLTDDLARTEAGVREALQAPSKDQILAALDVQSRMLDDIALRATHVPERLRTRRDMLDLERRIHPLRGEIGRLMEHIRYQERTRSLWAALSASGLLILYLAWNWLTMKRRLWGRHFRFSDLRRGPTADLRRICTLRKINAEHRSHILSTMDAWAALKMSGNIPAPARAAGMLRHLPMVLAILAEDRLSNDTPLLDVERIAHCWIPLLERLRCQTADAGKPYDIFAQPSASDWPAFALRLYCDINAAMRRDGEIDESQVHLYELPALDPTMAPRDLLARRQSIVRAAKELRHMGGSEDVFEMLASGKTVQVNLAISRVLNSALPELRLSALSKEDPDALWTATRRILEMTQNRRDEQQVEGLKLWLTADYNFLLALGILLRHTPESPEIQDAGRRLGHNLGRKTSVPISCEPAHAENPAVAWTLNLDHLVSRATRLFSELEVYEQDSELAIHLVGQRTPPSLVLSNPGSAPATAVQAAKHLAQDLCAEAQKPKEQGGRVLHTILLERKSGAYIDLDNDPYSMRFRLKE